MHAEHEIRAEPAGSRAPPLLRPGETCWRIEPAHRVALLLDAAACFAAMKAALLAARRSVLLLGWEFDPRTRLEPERPPGATEVPDAVGPLLCHLAQREPALDIRVLIWDAALPVMASRSFFPQRARGWFRGTRVDFRLDDAHPRGACHHQKLLVVDGAVAFCFGDDLSTSRWDTPAHCDRHPARRLPSGRIHVPRHSLAMLVDGDAARALDELARDRWRRATGEEIAAPHGPSAPEADPWPDRVAPDLTQVPVAIIRTDPPFEGRPAVRENEALYLDAIAGARRLIYFENQYFASPHITEALAARLAEPDGPEIVAILSSHSPSWFDRFVMDVTRDAMLARLGAGDPHGRFHAYAPKTPGGRTVIVHSKLLVVDDRLLRLGSANLNNRSFGYDTECDLAIETTPGAAGRRERATIRRLRRTMVAHFLGCGAGRLGAAERQSGSLAGAIVALDRGPVRRLQPLAPRGPSNPVTRLIASRHLGDPEGEADAWRPWRRRHGA
ncbi:MAG TPA: phospholipase D-like domain-containing protein [Falsiroseomonas sp.]|nr:phospholipase D-like domain-containing protein [Falsiroseomonas sp.]